RAVPFASASAPRGGAGWGRQPSGASASGSGGGGTTRWLSTFQEPKHFERARPNQLWQTDLFTFVLKRENRRVHLVGFLDDHSRFIVGYGLPATASGALVRETLLAAVANFGASEEVLGVRECAAGMPRAALRRCCSRRGASCAARKAPKIILCFRRGPVASCTELGDGRRSGQA